jgi:hypothetical protein
MAAALLLLKREFRLRLNFDAQPRHAEADGAAHLAVRKA